MQSSQEHIGPMTHRRDPTGTAEGPIRRHDPHVKFSRRPRAHRLIHPRRVHGSSGWEGGDAKLPLIANAMVNELVVRSPRPTAHFVRGSSPRQPG